MRLVSIIVLLGSSFNFSVSDQTSNNYEFLLFENFEVNKQNFIEDMQVFTALQETHTKLTKLRNFYHDELEFMKKQTKNPLAPIRSKQTLQNLLHLQSAAKLEIVRFNETKNKLTGLGKDFATEADFVASYKGLLQLAETYQLDLYSMSQNKMTYKGSVIGCDNGVKPFDVSDLSNMAVIASDMNRWDLSIDSLKAAFKLGELQPESMKQLKPHLMKLKKSLIKSHNTLVMKRKKRVGSDFKVHPYLVDENLERKKKQPKQLQSVEWFQRIGSGGEETQRGFGREDALQRTCNQNIRGNFTNWAPKCHFLHHHDPFLRLAPFKLEVLLHQPYRVLIHEIFTNPQGAMLFDIDYELPDNFQAINIVDPIMYKLSRKLELATNMNIVQSFSSSRYQTTNYGLGGLCETHTDPGGYTMENKLVDAKNNYIRMTGDMMATVMGWLDDVKAGGGTGFMFPYKEMLVEPRKGSIAFWMDLILQASLILRALELQADIS